MANNNELTRKAAMMRGIIPFSETLAPPPEAAPVVKTQSLKVEAPKKEKEVAEFKPAPVKRIGGAVETPIKTPTGGSVGKFTPETGFVFDPTFDPDKPIEPAKPVAQAESAAQRASRAAATQQAKFAQEAIERETKLGAKGVPTQLPEPLRGVGLTEQELELRRIQMEDANRLADRQFEIQDNQLKLELAKQIKALPGGTEYLRSKPFSQFTSGELNEFAAIAPQDLSRAEKERMARGDRLAIEALGIARDEGRAQLEFAKNQVERQFGRAIQEREEFNAQQDAKLRRLASAFGGGKFETMSANVAVMNAAEKGRRAVEDLRSEFADRSTLVQSQAAGLEERYGNNVAQIELNRANIIEDKAAEISEEIDRLMQAGVVNKFELEKNVSGIKKDYMDLYFEISQKAAEMIEKENDKLAKESIDLRRIAIAESQEQRAVDKRLSDISKIEYFDGKPVVDDEGNNIPIQSELDERDKIMSEASGTIYYKGEQVLVNGEPVKTKDEKKREFDLEKEQRLIDKENFLMEKFFTQEERLGSQFERTQERLREKERISSEKFLIQEERQRGQFERTQDRLSSQFQQTQERLREGKQKAVPFEFDFSVGQGQTRNRPDRNNNPFNIKRGGLADQFAKKGANGKPLTDNQNHLIFDDAQTGYMAGTQDVMAKIEGRTRNRKILEAISDKGVENLTIADIGKGFAEDPNWANGVARIMGTDSGAKVRNLDMNALFRAISKQEGFTGDIAPKQSIFPKAGTGSGILNFILGFEIAEKDPEGRPKAGNTTIDNYANRIIRGDIKLESVPNSESNPLRFSVQNYLEALLEEGYDVGEYISGANETFGKAFSITKETRDNKIFEVTKDRDGNIIKEREITPLKGLETTDTSTDVFNEFIKSKTQ